MAGTSCVMARKRRHAQTQTPQGAERRAPSAELPLRPASQPSATVLPSAWSPRPRRGEKRQEAPSHVQRRCVAPPRLPYPWTGNRHPPFLLLSHRSNLNQPTTGHSHVCVCDINDACSPGRDALTALPSLFLGCPDPNLNSHEALRCSSFAAAKLPFRLRSPALSLRTAWYDRSSSFSTAHRIRSAATAGHTLLSPLRIQ